MAKERHPESGTFACLPLIDSGLLFVSGPAGRFRLSAVLHTFLSEFLRPLESLVPRQALGDLGATKAVEQFKFSVHFRLSDG